MGMNLGLRCHTGRFSKFMLVCCVAMVSGGLHSPDAATLCDFKKARQWTPRSAYRGWGSSLQKKLIDANYQLNKHLQAHPNITLKACENWDIVELRALLSELSSRSSPELIAIYSKTDGRRVQYDFVSEMEAEWRELGVDVDIRVRDAHCHEAVMWYVHHLASPTQSQVRASFTLPLLPVTVHSNGTRQKSDKIGQFYDRKVTCQDCHIGGFASFPPPSPPPKDLPTNAKGRSRQCDTNFKDLYGIDCGPCDGINGIATGEALKYFTPTKCQIVSLPHQVKEDERVKVAFPEIFTVEVAGSSDHFGPTATSPGHALYSLSHGMMYGKIASGSKLWLLRHETNFTSIMKNGVSVPLGDNPYTAQVHAQTLKQRAEGAPGAQVLLSSGMPTGLPSGLPEGCSCHEDVVGVPSMQRLNNLQYKGRIRLPELEFLGGEIELDHWANWFFHIFMDTNTSAPHYAKAPSRISDGSDGSQKTGLSVYGRWKFEDPELNDPGIWNRGLPTAEQISGGQKCSNPDGKPVCHNISQSTFPPAGQGSPCPFRG